MTLTDLIKESTAILEQHGKIDGQDIELTEVVPRVGIFPAYYDLTA